MAVRQPRSPQPTKVRRLVKPATPPRPLRLPRSPQPTTIKPVSLSQLRNQLSKIKKPKVRSPQPTKVGRRRRP